MKKILIIAPHPDDEILGCGGTLLKHKIQNKDEIYCAYITNLRKTNKGFKKRNNQIKEVSKKINFNDHYIGKFYPTELSEKNLPNIIEFLKKIITKIKPNTIYAPFEHDIHTDHKIVFDASKSFIKSYRYDFIKNFYIYETLSETNFTEGFAKENFKPNLFVDISKFIKKKINLANIYKSEFKKHPFPRSSEAIKSLATLRGSFSNHKYAESFMILKQIKE